MNSRGCQDSSINERRLRPIYDCLDNGSYKKALQEAEKLLKKQKNSQCARVLKSLALLRLGNVQKSLNLLEEVKNEVPIDDFTLQTMAICYKELNMTDQITLIYEKASEKKPKSEELLIALFYAYVRVGNFKKQQQIALTLYKLCPLNNQYYFWAIISVYMQAFTARDEEISQKMLLPLAQKMCKKIIDEDKIIQENKLQVYLMVLMKQENYNEMLKVINGPLSKYLTDYLDFLKRKKASLYFKVGLYQEAFETLRLLVDTHVDQLEYYLQIFDAAFMLDMKSANHQSDQNIAQSNDAVSRPTPSSYVRRVIDIVLRNLSKCDKNINKKNGKQLVKSSQIRGPNLAKIELYEMIKSKLEPSQQTLSYLSMIGDDYSDLVYNYYSFFGHKDACFYDMTYLFIKYKKSNEHVIQVIDKIKAQCNPRKSDFSSIDDVYRYLCLLRLEHYAGLYSNKSKEEISAVIAEIIDYLDLSLKFETMSFANDFKPADPFILALFSISVELAMGDDAFLLSLITILTRSLKKGPNNSATKLCLLKLYNIIGASYCSHEWFESMDIKHILHDTIGHVIYDTLFMTGAYPLAANKVSKLVKFYGTNRRDSFDYLVSFYKTGSYSRIEEIMRLMEKLNNSFNFATSLLDGIVVKSILMPKNSESFSNAIMSCDSDLDKVLNMSESDEFCDNRDFSIFRVSDFVTKEDMRTNQERYFEDQKEWIKIRALLMKNIIAAYNWIAYETALEMKNGEAGEQDMPENSNSDVFKTYDDLSHHYEKLKVRSLHFKVFPLQGTQPSRINYYLDMNFFEVVVKLLSQMKTIYSPTKENKTSLDTGWLTILEKVIKKVTHDFDQISSLTKLGRCLADLSVLIETFCFVTVILGLMHKNLQRDMLITKKYRKKKGTDSLSIQSFVEQFNEFITNLDNYGKDLINFISKIDWGSYLNYSCNPNIIPTRGEFSLNPEEYPESYKDILKKIELSYENSTNQMLARLSTKLKYSISLKL